MKIEQKHLTIQDQTWIAYTLINDSNMSVELLNYGGIITKIRVPDQNGTSENVVLGFKNYEEYLTNPPFLGALIGRVAGRIQGSQFELNGKTYSLPINDGANHLHGGPEGLNQVLWESTTYQNEQEIGVVLTHQSPNGAGGYPGTLELKVTYSLTHQNELSIAYEAVSDQDTVLTLTNHSYFNLSGDLKTTIKNHNVTLDASRFVELDDALIPTGTILEVDGTPFDFRGGRRVEDGIDTSHPQNLVASHGYDHFFLFDQEKKAAAIVEDPISGRKMTVETTQPGVVFYTSNTLGDGLELLERQSEDHLGLCLETQSSPASLHLDGFPSIMLKKEERYNQKTIFRFEA